jgi:hypothetical protein
VEFHIVIVQAFDVAVFIGNGGYNRYEVRAVGVLFFFFFFIKLYTSLNVMSGDGIPSRLTGLVYVRLFPPLLYVRRTSSQLEYTVTSLGENGVIS